MLFELNVKKKAFKAEGGEEKTYYSLTVDIGGETIKLKADDKDKKLLNYFLDKCDIPLEREDSKAELMKRLLSGETLSAGEKAVLKGLLSGEED